MRVLIFKFHFKFHCVNQFHEFTVDGVGRVGGRLSAYYRHALRNEGEQDPGGPWGCCGR